MEEGKGKLELISKAEVDRIAWRKSEVKGSHEYILTKDHPEFTVKITHAIKDHGEVSEFKGRRYRYFFLEGFKYWRMGVVVNRAQMP